MTMKEFEKLAEKAWQFANSLMELDDKKLQISGIEWTGIAKILDEISGRYDWGILKDLKKEINEL